MEDPERKSDDDDSLLSSNLFSTVEGTFNLTRPRPACTGIPHGIRRRRIWRSGRRKRLVKVDTPFTVRTYSLKTKKGLYAFFYEDGTERFPGKRFSTPEEALKFHDDKYGRTYVEFHPLTRKKK